MPRKLWSNEEDENSDGMSDPSIHREKKFSGELKRISLECLSA
jgi:hypothetical protein